MPQLKTNEPGPANHPYSGLPTCFAMAISLEKEVAFHDYPTERYSETTLQDAISGYEELLRIDPSQSEKLVAVLSRQDRHCQKWRRWQQGFTPKEHREMLDREWMLKYQAERKESDRNFRLRMAEDNRKWQAQQQTRLALIAGIFVIIGAIIGALVVYFR